MGGVALVCGGDAPPRDCGLCLGRPHPHSVARAVIDGGGPAPCLGVKLGQQRVHISIKIEFAQDLLE